MTESTFCLNPLGWSPWTLRFYQAVMTRCIPVVIADDIEFPFENQVRRTSVAWRSRDELSAVLRSAAHCQRGCSLLTTRMLCLAVRAD